jgi:RNA polymerase sigma-70 factor (ECF subfamily)
MTPAERIEKLGQYRPQLVRFARMRLQNPAHAEDAVQEAMLAAIQGIDKYAGGSSVLTWLTGILKHKIVDCVRRSARDQWHELDNDGTPLPVEDRDFTPIAQYADATPGAIGPEQALTHQRLLEALDRCVRQLPSQAAQTYVLRDLVGMSAAEASRVLAVSESNCSVLLHRARARIRKGMGPGWAMQ